MMVSDYERIELHSLSGSVDECEEGHWLYTVVTERSTFSSEVDQIGVQG